MHRCGSHCWHCCWRSGYWARTPPGTGAAAPDDDLRVYTDAPRLFLTPARLRLLQREKDRKSLRWEQFDLLMSGGAKMPEPGFAGALLLPGGGRCRVGAKSGGVGPGRRRAGPPAVGSGVRLVRPGDDCAAVRTAGRQDPKGAGRASHGRGNPSTARQSAQVLGIIAIADRFQDHGEAALKPIVAWWRDLAGKLETGDASFPRADTYALFEMLHAVRDNLKIDLRDDARRYFRDLPLDHMASHYPAVFRLPKTNIACRSLYATAIRT